MICRLKPVLPAGEQALVCLEAHTLVCILCGLKLAQPVFSSPCRREGKGMRTAHCYPIIILTCERRSVP